MEKAAFVVFRADCCGCHACEVACKQEHGLGVGPRLIRIIEKSPDFIPLYFHHCASAPCAEACPAGVILRNELGIVLIDGEVCIGCKECVDACPFGAMQFDGETAVKCDLCRERLASGQGPVCASVCPTGCIFYGDATGLADRKAELAARR